MRADWTKPNKEIEDALKRFDSISIPLTVIYRADSPDDPIILRDVYSQSTLLEKLEEAASSKGKASSATAKKKPELPWQPYSDQRLDEELKQGKIVLIDFTADW